MFVITNGTEFNIRLSNVIKWLSIFTIAMKATSVITFNLGWLLLYSLLANG